MAQTDSPPRAVRLIFEYEGDAVRLISQQPVDMAVASFDPSQRQQPGVWLSRRSSRGRRRANWQPASYCVRA
jgi:hypothetical protein